MADRRRGDEAIVWRCCAHPLTLVACPHVTGRAKHLTARAVDVALVVIIYATLQRKGSKGAKGATEAQAERID
jgi:hypothetical protein